MFTGIITDVGRVLEVADGGGRRMTIGTLLPLAEIPLGSSIATSGICFSAVDKGADWFGDTVNLERSLRIGDEMGGHIVFGHVDAVGEILALEPAGASHRLEVRVPANLAPLIAVKGSIAVDGISLTVNQAGADRFALNIIPHTWRATNLAERTVGDRVNVEVDMLARYVARQLAFRREV
jgi:riboflavin synthase